jgi:hypothetical protein
MNQQIAERVIDWFHLRLAATSNVFIVRLKVANRHDMHD